MQIEDASVDLAVSRGPLPFWDDLQTVFGELRRILKTDGCAYIGGGLGPPEMRETFREQVRRHYPEWNARERAIPRRETGECEEALQAAGIEVSAITRGDEGTWIEFRKS